MAPEASWLSKTSVISKYLGVLCLASFSTYYADISQCGCLFWQTFHKKMVDRYAWTSSNYPSIQSSLHSWTLVYEIVTTNTNCIEWIINNFKYSLFYWSSIGHFNLLHFISLFKFLICLLQFLIQFLQFQTLQIISIIGSVMQYLNTCSFFNFSVKIVMSFKYNIFTVSYC